MVVKVKSGESKASSDPLRGVQKEPTSTELEFSRLKNLVPAISRKSSVSKLDVILEAIRYIDQLQDQLLDQINDSKYPLSAANLLVGKENTNASILMQLQRHRYRRNRSVNGEDEGEDEAEDEEDEEDEENFSN